MTARSIHGAVLVIAVLITLAAAPSTAQMGQMQQIQYGEIMAATPAIVARQAGSRRTRGGATVGAIAGAALAKRGDRWIGGLIGGAIGGAVGRSADEAAARVEGWDLIVRLEQGNEVAIQLPHRREQFREGDKVRLLVDGAGADVQRLK
jgi:outer membrane lipoprotein SlyB